MTNLTTAKRIARTRKITNAAVCQTLEGRLLFSTVAATSLPFTGTPMLAGQTIEAENYDLGGEGVAYHDTTKGNITKGYRTDDVDIQAGGSNGFNIGNTFAGEWMNYTITVPADGAYIFSASASAPTTGAKFHAEFDGTNVTGSIAVPNTKAWLSFATVNSPSFQLTAGTHVMRVMFDSNLNGMGAVGNFDTFAVTAVTPPVVTPPIVTPPVVIPPVVIPPVTPPVLTTTPFTGTPIVAGQPIEAENYDLGGEGVAYHDTTPGNIGKAYRTEDVDIQAGGSNGFNVGSTAAGEWMNYTISVPTTGSYTFSALASAPTTGAKFHAEFDGTNLTGSLAVPNSKAWTNWTNVTSPSFQLTAGTHVMRVVFDANLNGMGAVGNFDLFNVTATIVPPVVIPPVVIPPVVIPPVVIPPVASTPFHGTPLLVGQPIQAEDYDLGGEGVAYHDSTKGNLGKSYRNDDVDIQAPGSNGFNVGSTLAGEWLNYTISVPTTGSYIFTARASAPTTGATFHAEFDGTNLTGALAVPNTGGWVTWGTAASSSFQLTAGVHVMRVVIDTNLKGWNAAGNFDVFNVTPILAGPTLTWTAAAPSPALRYEGYGRSFGGKLYIFGGFSTITEHLTNSDYASYDPSTNQWTNLGQLPCPTTHAAVAFDDVKGIMYFIGGLNGPYPSVASTSVWAYDIPSNTWSQLPSLPVGSAAGGAVLLNGQLHYFAGIQSDHNTDVNVHYVLSLGDTTWHNAAAFPMARDHITAVALNGEIYSFGGEIGHDLLHQQQTEVDMYDPNTDAWTQLADMPMSKSHVEASTFISNGKIIIAGGQIDDHASTNTVLEYDPTANTWAILGNLPGPLQGTFLQPLGNQLILTNGYDGTNLQAGTWIADWTNGA